MAKTKIRETFEMYAVVNDFGCIVVDEFTNQPLVFVGEADAYNDCDDEAGEKVVRIEGYYHYSVKS